MWKIEKGMEMVKEGMKGGVGLEYVVIERWFRCGELVGVIRRGEMKWEVIGMMKMGNRKYDREWGEVRGKGIMKKVEKEGVGKDKRRVRCR